MTLELGESNAKKVFAGRLNDGSLEFEQGHKLVKVIDLHSIVVTTLQRYSHPGAQSIACRTLLENYNQAESKCIRCEIGNSFE